MSDVLSLQGSITTGEGCGCATPFSPSVAIPIETSLPIKGAVNMGEFELTDDSPVSVPLAALAKAHVVFLHVTGGKVRARLTSADGSSQAIPVDPVLYVQSESVPFTALDLTRAAGTHVTVRVLLAESAA